MDLFAGRNVPRVYHTVALLLPDGSVWTAGSTPSRETAELRTEIYKPDYFFSGTRPTISASPLVGDYGNSITISTPDAANISVVSLVKLPCATHSYDVDTRLVWLAGDKSQFRERKSRSAIERESSTTGILYDSCIKRVEYSFSCKNYTNSRNRQCGIPDTTPPVQVAGLTVTPVGSTQLNLAWTANTETDLNHYNVYRGTTAGFAVTLGTTTPVGTPTTNSYQNTGLSPSTTYYYKVSAVDNAGNIGPLSAERSGTTGATADTTPPVQVAGLGVTTASSTQLNLAWTQNQSLTLTTIMSIGERLLDLP